MLLEERLNITFPIPRIVVPFPKKLKFEKCIKADKNSPAYADLINLTKVRNEFIDACAARGTSTERLSNALKTYVPLLFGFTVAMETNENAAIAEPLNFQWFSAFRADPNTSRREYFGIYDPEGEVIMTLTALALMHYNTAAALALTLQREPGKDVPKPEAFNATGPRIANSLKMAAGVFSFLANEEILRWQDVPKEQPPESIIQFARAMEMLCLGIAQAFMAVKGVSTKIKPALLARLFADAHQKISEAARMLAMKQDKKTSNVSEYLLKTVKALADYAHMITIYYMCVDATADDARVGQAVAFGREAQRLGAALTSQNLGSQWEILLQDVKSDINTATRGAESANNICAHQPVPDFAALGMPDARCMVAPIEYVPTKVDVVIV